MNFRSRLILLVLVLFGFSTITFSQTIPGKFAPKDGKTMLIIGQDLGSVAGYTNSGKFPTPAGITMYTDIYAMNGLNDIINYGGGDIGLQASMDRYPNSALSIGLWMVEEADGKGEDHPNGLNEIINGQHDDELIKFRDFAKRNAPRPIYLRIGYEFDGTWNNYNAGKYVAAYKYIVDFLNAQGVTNIAYVWQSATYGSDAPNKIDSYYPGDDYVDYVGLSFFFYDSAFNGDNLDYILNYARARNKPIMMAEVSAQYYEFDQGTFHSFDNPGNPTTINGQGIWDQYFKNQLIPFIDNNRDIIRAVAYINADWQSQLLWKWPDANNGFWGDTRIETDNILSNNWNNYITNGNFLHGSPNLLSDLGITNTPTISTCSDGIKNQNETGIDCGGNCAPCQIEPTCNDGIQNGNETGVDCGGDCNACSSPPNNSTLTAKLLPPDNKILLTIGQDLKTLYDYQIGGVNNRNFPAMGGTTTYISFYSLLSEDFPQYGALGETVNGDVARNMDNSTVDVDWGSGPLNARSTILGYEESSLSIGLSMTEGENTGSGVNYWCEGCLKQVAQGVRDNEIKRLATFFKKYSNKAIYLRIAYEFDGNWNVGYENRANYIGAYKRIVDVLRAEGVTNVAFVWQSSASPIDDVLDIRFGEGNFGDIASWYPGDNYVDWVALSWFITPDEKTNNQANIPSQREKADEVLQFARSKNKPVYIAESTPQGYDLTNLTDCNISEIWDGTAAAGCNSKSASQIWNEWYAPYFEYIYANKDIIRHVHYINANWEDDTRLFGSSNRGNGYWGRASVQSNNSISNNWKNEINKSVWLHGNNNLNARLLNNESSFSQKGTSANQFDQKLLIYPNPSKGTISISGNFQSQNGNLYVLDISGKVIKTIKLDVTEPLVDNVINMEAFTKGVYFIKIETDKKTITKKLILQ